MSPQTAKTYLYSFNRNFLHLPVGWIDSNPRIGPYLPKLVWVSLFLQYFVLTFDSGASRDTELPLQTAALLVLTAMIFGLSVSLGLIGEILGTALGHAPGRRSDRIRNWSIALFTTWGMTLFILTATFVTKYYLSPAVPPPKPLPIAELPIAELRAGLITYLKDTSSIWVQYSLVAALIMCAAPRLLQFLRRNDPAPTPSSNIQAVPNEAFAPNLLMVVVINALLVTVLFSVPQLSEILRLCCFDMLKSFATPW
jgi:hypothetical protein